MPRRLVAYLSGRRVGWFSEESGRVSFLFDDVWRRGSGGLELSLSLPKASREHRGDAPINYLWGLLPDNDQVLRRWGMGFGVNPRNPMALLEQVGLDAPGAIQLTPEDMETLPADDGWVPLSIEEISDHLRALHQDQTSWLFADRAEGRFSLAGAQAKFALSRVSDGWALPAGRGASTHIVKPGIVGLELSDVNEHLHLVASRSLGLTAVSSSIEHFGTESAIVVERYDREIESDGTVRRIHQEDLVQAVGLPPTLKYQADGGPGIDRIARFLHDQLPRRSALDAIDRFFDAVIFNWIVAGTDGHAKNYSLLHTTSGSRLAPLYDLAGVLAYPEFAERKIKLAMSIAGRYRLWEITAHHIASQADRIGLDADAAVQRARAMVAAAPDAFADAARTVESTEPIGAFCRRLVDGVASRSTKLTTQLKSGAPAARQPGEDQHRDERGRFQPERHS